MNDDRAVIPYVGARSSAFAGAEIGFFLVTAVAAYSLHASEAELGAINIARSLAPLLAPVLLTAVAERGQPLFVLRMSDFVRAALVLAFVVVPIASGSEILLLAGLVLLLGLNNFVAEVVTFRATPEVVSAGILDSANGWLESARSAAGIIGPAIAGFMIVLLPGRSAFSFEVFFFALAGILMMLVHPPGRSPDEGDAMARSSALPVILGIRLIFESRSLRGVALTSAFFNILGYCLATVEAVFIYQTLRLEPAAFGIAMTIAAGGGIVGGLLAGKAERFGRRRVMASLLLVAGLSQAIQVLAVGSDPMSLVLITVGAFVAECAAVCFIVLNAGVRQRCTPAALRGRVGGAYIWITRGGGPIGAAAAPLLLLWVDPRWSIVALSVATSLTGVFFFRSMRATDI